MSNILASVAYESGEGLMDKIESGEKDPWWGLNYMNASVM